MVKDKHIKKLFAFLAIKMTIVEVHFPNQALTENEAQILNQLTTLFPIPGGRFTKCNLAITMYKLINRKDKNNTIWSC